MRKGLGVKAWAGPLSGPADALRAPGRGPAQPAVPAVRRDRPPCTARRSRAVSSLRDSEPSPHFGRYLVRGGVDLSGGLAPAQPEPPVCKCARPGRICASGRPAKRPAPRLVRPSLSHSSETSELGNPEARNAQSSQTSKLGAPGAHQVIERQAEGLALVVWSGERGLPAALRGEGARGGTLPEVSAGALAGEDHASPPPH